MKRLMDTRVREYDGVFGYPRSRVRRMAMDTRIHGG
jgi:hypothetical protein